MPDQVFGTREVAGLACRELEEDRPASAVDERVELGREPASGATQTSIDPRSEERRVGKECRL